MKSNVNELGANDRDGLKYYLSNVLKSFLIIFLPSSLLFGIYRMTKTTSPIEGLYQGLIFGLLLSIILIVLMASVDLFERLRFSKKFKKMSFRVPQERKLFLYDDYDKTFELLLSILNRVDFRIENQDKRNGTIIARTGRSWRSFGERIIIMINKGTSEKLFIKLSSKPILFLTRFDYCKNMINIETLLINLKNSDLKIEYNG